MSFIKEFICVTFIFSLLYGAIWLSVGRLAKKGLPSKPLRIPLSPRKNTISSGPIYYPPMPVLPAGTRINVQGADLWLTDEAKDKVVDGILTVD